MRPRSLLPLILLPLAALAAEPADRSPVEPRSLPAPDQPVAGEDPAIETLPDGSMKLGDIIFHPKTREIRFPAEINMTEGLLEFLIVHENGKIHESLLATNISPTHLNLVFKLLRYKESREFYYKVNEDDSLSGEFEPATPEQKASARITLAVEHEVDGTKKSALLNDWITHAPTEKTMPHDPWVYGGSNFWGGRFVAEGSGDIAAIFLSNSAIINYSGEDNHDDRVWLPHPKRVPPIGTKVTVVIAPFHKATPP